jgi:hypothetical protein
VLALQLVGSVLVLQLTGVSFCAFSFEGLVVDEAAVGVLAVGKGSSTTHWY